MRRFALPPAWRNRWDLATFDMDHESGLQRWGSPHGVEEEAAVGEPTEQWALGFDCGLEVLLSFRQRSRTWHLESNLPEPEHALLHLELPRERIRWRNDHARPEPPAESWTVWRQDDYGNRFPMEVLATERTARCLADIYEARAHKQSYQVERARAPTR